MSIYDTCHVSRCMHDMLELACRRAGRTATRAKAARNAIVAYYPLWPQGRMLDNCFESGDGDAVMRLLLAELPADPPLLRAMRSGFSKAPEWLTKIELAAKGGPLFGGSP